MKHKLCKKLFAAIVAAAMFALAGSGALSAAFPSNAPVVASAEEINPPLSLSLISEETSGVTASHNIGGHNYYWAGRDINTWNWAEKAKSYMAVNSDGTFTRAEYIDSKLTVEVYTMAFKRKSVRTVSIELPIFGGVFFGSTYNFIVSGKENPSYSDSAEVVRVIKYDKSWTRLGSVSLRGRNTYVPFEAGTVSMAESSGKLFIHTCHKMYPDSNGVNHQANMTYFLDEDSLKVTYENYKVSNTSTGYVSHSFNQVVRSDGSYVYTVDHGDAHPRSFYLVKRKLDGSMVGSTSLFSFKGESGDNLTKATLGDMQFSGSKLLTVGVSVRQNDTFASNTQRNVFLSVVDKNSFSTKSITWLTSFAERSGWLVSNPYLVKTGSDRFLVLWEELMGSSGYLKCAVIDGSGNLVGSVYRLVEGATEGLSDCAPIVQGGNVIWYSTGSRKDPWNNQVNAMPKFYKIPVNPNAVQPPEITSHPKKTTVVVGQTASFSVKATGTGLKYQWFYQKANTSGWVEWTGKTSATVSGKTDASWNGMRVYCMVWNALGKWVNSNITSVNLIIPVKITQHPANVSAGTDEKVTFAVKTSGTGAVTYQWYFKKTTSTSWVKWTGKTTATISGTTNITWDGMQVYCHVEDDNGYTADSNPAKVTLNRKLEITTQPESRFIVLGNSGTVSLKAVGVLPTYQWYYMKKGQTAWSKWSGKTHASETFTPDASWNGAKLYCLVKDRDNNSVKSITVQLTVDYIIIVSQPRVTFVKSGDTAYFTVNALGNGLRYQWYFMKDGATKWAAWSGRTSVIASGTANNTWDKMKVMCKMTDSDGHSKNTSAVAVTICTEEEWKISSTTTITMTVSAGDNYKYQWYYKKEGSKVWTPWSGKTTGTLQATANSSWDGMLIHCRVYATDGIDHYNKMKKIVF